MEFLTILLMYLLVGGACMYLLMCADPHGKGPISYMNRFVYSVLPNAYRNHGHKLIGKCGMRMIDNLFAYICYKNHPLVQIMYLLIVFGGFYGFMRYGLMEHVPTKKISENFYYYTTVFTAWGLYTYYKTCAVDPGIITKENVQMYLKKYKYDGVIYEENKACPTCKIPKPARSKHCRVCNVCVAKFDHHCVWVRQCVGEKNYKWFFSFIVSHALLCLYGGFVALYILREITIENRLFDMQFRMSASGDIVKANWLIVIQYLFYKYTMLFFVLVLCMVMGIALSLFSIYHALLIRNGTTTNEKIKKGDLDNAIVNEISNIESALKNPKQPAEAKKKLEGELKLFRRDQGILDRYFEKGLWKNLKRVYSE